MPLKLEFKPSVKESLIIILGIFLIMLMLENFEIINFFSQNSERGFLYDYQVLIGGLLAFGAGYFVYASTKLNLHANKIKNDETEQKYRLYYKKVARDTTFHCDMLIKIISEQESLSVNTNLLVKPFNINFLRKDEHIQYFNKEEIKKINFIEEMIYHSNILINQMLDWSKDNPSKPYKTFFKKEDCDATILQRDTACALEKLLNK